MIIFLLILSVAVGAVLGSFFGKNEGFAKKLLILSAGFLITICLNEVFPEVYKSNIHNIGLFVIGGVILQMLLENLTKGFEHGHIHHHDGAEHSIIPYSLIAGLFIHAFIEGIPLANEKSVFTPYLMGIIVHNLPISFVLGAFLFRNRYTFPSVLIISVFALSSPMGMLLGKYFDPNLQPYFLAIVGGIFLHISSVIIFESNKNHKMEWTKIILVIVGVLLAYGTHLVHEH
ncbi:ZIP family metal transporter [Weeksellaceae bacterium A-14]